MKGEDKSGYESYHCALIRANTRCDEGVGIAGAQNIRQNLCVLQARGRQKVHKLPERKANAASDRRR